MENKVFAILKKISKAQKTELSAVSDLEDAYESFDSAVTQRLALLDSIDNMYKEVTSILSDLNYELGLYEEISSESEELRVKVSDILQDVEMKAEELGAAPFEFIPNYDDIVNDLEVTFDDDVLRDALEIATGY